MKDGSVVQANEYDGLNRRIIRDETGGGGVLTHYYYNQRWQVIEERIGTATTADKQYIYHPHYVDAIAVRYWDQNNSADDVLETAHYFLQDANYNVTAVADSDGDTVERYEYTPYGEATVLHGASDAEGNEWDVDTNGTDIENDLLYTGRRRDPETGLQLNRNRFYHQQLGRWVTRDPIGFLAGMNLYEYAGSYVTMFVDPSGLIGLVGAPKPIPFPEEQRPPYNPNSTGPHPGNTYRPLPDMPGFCCNVAEKNSYDNAKEYCKDNDVPFCELNKPEDLKKCIDDLDDCIDDLKIPGHGSRTGYPYIGPVDPRDPGGGPGRVDPTDDLGNIFGDKSNYCDDCVIEMSGCFIGSRRDSIKFMDAIAKQTGCSVRAPRGACFTTGQFPGHSPDGWEWVHPPQPPIWPKRGTGIWW